MVKLNLGSGIGGSQTLYVLTEDHTDWKNIEIFEAYEAHEHYDISTGIRELDNSVEEIWMGDFFEHLLRLKAKFVMTECFRVLKPRGRLRMSVPDMAVVMPLWLASDSQYECDIEDGIIYPLFNHIINQELYDLIWGGQDESYQRNSISDSHFSGYTEKSLKKMMSKVGFSSINRISIHRTWYELAIEAYK
jgi:predicted SAM-dependent methyltransferase